MKQYIINNFHSIKYIIFNNDSNKFIKLSVLDNYLSNLYEYDYENRKWDQILKEIDQDNVLRFINLVLIPLDYEINIKYKEDIGGTTSELEYGINYFDLTDFFPITNNIINYIILNFFSIKNLLLYDPIENIYLNLVFKLIYPNIFVDVYEYNFVNKEWKKDEDLNNSTINEIIDFLNDSINNFKIKILFNESTGGFISE